MKEYTLEDLLIRKEVKIGNIVFTEPSVGDLMKLTDGSKTKKKDATIVDSLADELSICLKDKSQEQELKDMLKDMPVSGVSKISNAVMEDLGLREAIAKMAVSQ